MSKSRDKIGETFTRLRGMSAVVAPGERVLDIIAERWGPLKGAEKLLARAASATPNAARNWLARRNQPRIEHVLALHARDAEFRRRFMALLRETEGEDECVSRSFRNGDGSA